MEAALLLANSDECGELRGEVGAALDDMLSGLEAQG
jgi:hypothetical protein